MGGGTERHVERDPQIAIGCHHRSESIFVVAAGQGNTGNRLERIGPTAAIGVLDMGHLGALRDIVTALGRGGDVLLAISTSGNSPNIVEAVRVARDRGMKTIGLLGGDGGALQDLVDFPLTVSVSSHTPRIQEGHLIIMHALCELSEAALAETPNPENSHE